jgi:hypothetical protein
VNTAARVLSALVTGVALGWGAADLRTPAYPDHLVFDHITREQWWSLGYGTDPTEVPHQSGDFWCKKHIDGNGDHCEASYNPNYRKTDR